MTEPDDQKWSRRRLRNEANGADSGDVDARVDGSDSNDADSRDLPRATPLSPRGPAEPLSYITQERGGGFRPRHDDDQLPPTEAIEQVDAPGYRVRDFSPEGRGGVPSWAPAYTQTRNPFASTADQAAQGQADAHGELDYQTARRDEVIPPAAESGVNEPPPITESIPIYNGERTMTRRELRALREARAAEAAKTGIPAPDIFVTSITGVPQERPVEGEPVETAPAERAEEPAPIDRPATERPAWAPVFTDVPDAVSPAAAETAESSPSDAAELAEEQDFLAQPTTAPDATAVEHDEATAERDASAEVAVDDARAAEAPTDEAAADVAQSESPADVEEPEASPATSVPSTPTPATPYIAGPPQPVELVEPPAPARWTPDAAGEGSVFDQLLSGADAPAAPAAPSIDELLFGAPTPPPADEAPAEVPADAAEPVDDGSAPTSGVESDDDAPAQVDDEVVAPQDETADDTEAADSAVDATAIEADAAAGVPVEGDSAEPIAVESDESDADVAPSDESAVEQTEVVDETAAADETVVVEEPAGDATPADDVPADEIPADETPAVDAPQLPSLGDLPPPGAAPAEPNGDPNSFLGAAPSVSERVDMPAPPAWRAPEPPQQGDEPATADDDEIVVEPAPADAPVEAHPVVVDVTPLPAEPLPPVADEVSTATHWADPDQDTHGDFVASRDVIGGHGVVTTNALVLPSIPQPELAGPLTTTGEIIITGSIDLPRSLSSTGAHPTQLDESALDHELDPGDHQVASTDSQPVRAIRAVSTHTSTRGMMSNPKPRSNRTLTVLIIASASLAVLVAGVLVFSLVTGQF